MTTATSLLEDKVRWLRHALIGLLALLPATGHGQAISLGVSPTTQTFTGFITGAPLATLPFGATEVLPVIQGGKTKNFQANLMVLTPQLPSCPDTGGNHLNYVPGSGFLCGTSGGGGGGGVSFITGIGLSGNTFVGGVPSGTAIGTISVTMQPTSPAFSGSLSLSGTNASSFQIVGTTLETNGVVPAGSYSFNIVATQFGIVNSPFTQAETAIGAQTIGAVSLSNATFTGGSPNGTVVGAVSVTMSPPSPAFAGSLSLTGPNASSFQISGSNLETNGVVSSGSYNVNIIATQPGAAGSPFSQPETLTGVPQTIVSVQTSAVAFAGGSATGTVVGTISTTMAPGSPAFRGTYALTGANAADFQIVSGNILETVGTLTAGTYNFNIVATQAGISNSPFTQAVTIVGYSTTWVTDQTLQMPYYCATTIWINPSPSPSGPTGGGKANGSGGLGTQAAPFLHVSDLTGTTLTPGTCINLLNTATLYDTWNTSTASVSGTFSNTPTGYIALRSTDNTGSPVPAVSTGGVINSSAATWISSSQSHNVGQLRIINPSDYWIVDGINFWMRGQDRISGLECIHVGDNPGQNAYNGLSHFQGRNNYVHGCGAGAFAVAGSDYISLQDNVCQSVTISQPSFQESCFSVAGSTTANGYTPTGYDSSLCTTLGGSCQPYHVIVSGNMGYDPYEALVNSSSDGNCVIIDTNILPASQTNAGGFLSRSLVANNVCFHTGGKGIHIFVSQHVDVVNNTVIASTFDYHNPATFRTGVDCDQTVDCVVVNNLAYAVSQNTTIKTTATGTTFAVDNAAGWLYALFNPPVPVSPSAPIDALVDGISNTVIGATLDQTNTSTTPGGASGTLTFGTSVSSPHGNSGVAILASSSTNGSGPNDPVWIDNAALADAQGAFTLDTCINWAQPAPCSGGNKFTVTFTGTSDYWYNNLGTAINTWLTQPSPASASSTFCTCAVPPTQTTAPGNNILDTNPLFTTTFFSISPNYEMKGIAVSATGNTCTAGEMITLAGGTPATAAIVQVDVVSGGHILVSHLFDGGSYPNSSTTTFTEGSTTGSCTGVTFSGATFFQPFLSTSRPNPALAGGSPALAAGNTNYVPSHNFLGSVNSSPPNIGAY